MGFLVGDSGMKLLVGTTDFRNNGLVGTELRNRPSLRCRSAAQDALDCDLYLSRDGSAHLLRRVNIRRDSVQSYLAVLVNAALFSDPKDIMNVNTCRIVR
jgi:hypothetical protein